MENETKGGGGSFWKKESRLQLERNVFMEGGGVYEIILSLSLWQREMKANNRISGWKREMRNHGFS